MKITDYPTRFSRLRVGHSDTRVGELGASAFGNVVSHHWQPGGRCSDMGTFAKISNFLGIDASCDYDADKFAKRAELESWNNWGGGPSLAENLSEVSGTQFAIDTKNNVMPGIFAERVVKVDAKPKPAGKYMIDFLTLGKGADKFEVRSDKIFSNKKATEWLKYTGFADVFPKEVLDTAELYDAETIRTERRERELMDNKVAYPDYHRDNVGWPWEGKVQIGQLLVATPDWYDVPSRIKPTEWIIDDVKGKGKGLWHSEPSYHNGNADRMDNVVLHRLYLYADEGLQADGKQKSAQYADYDGNEIHVGGGETVNFKGGLFMQAANLNPDLDLDLPPSLV